MNRSEFGLVPDQDSGSSEDQDTRRKEPFNFCLCFVVVALFASVGVIAWIQIRDHLLSSGSHPLGLPAIEPPVRSTAPADLGAPTASTASTVPRPRLSSISPETMRDTLFKPGPVNVFTILANVDMRVREMDSRADQFPCLNGTSYANYTLSVWGDDPVVLRAQCYDVWATGSFILVSVNRDSTMHLYDKGGEVAVAALVSMNLTTRNVTRVEVWYAVGLSTQDGSAGVAHIVALPNATRFEMAVAGHGVGFCGAQIVSDGTTVRLTGSEDLGFSCAPTDTICVSAANVSVPVNCTESVSSFTLRALGRQSFVNANGTTLDASHYPGGANNTVVLRADGNDTSLFGPLTLPAGL